MVTTPYGVKRGNENEITDFSGVSDLSQLLIELTNRGQWNRTIGIQNFVDAIEPLFGTSVGNPVNVTSLDDLPSPVGNVITLEAKTYIINGNINIGLNKIRTVGGAVIQGYSANQSSLASSNPDCTVEVSNGGFAANAILGDGGLAINNTGGGSAVKVLDTSTICFISRLLTSNAGIGCEVNDSNVVIESWTLLSGVTHGFVMTGTANTGPIIRDFNPISLTGKGIDIQGNITSGALRIRDAIINNVAGNAVEVSGSIQGMSFDGDAKSTGGNGMKISGTIAGGLLLENTNIISNTLEGMDIRGSAISTIIATGAGITAIAAGKSALIGDAGGVNITGSGKALFSTSQIDNPIDTTAAPLSGIQKTDLKYFFTNAGARITNSTIAGSLTLDAPTSTVATYQGFDFNPTAWADSPANPGIDTRVTIGAHTLLAGTPVAVIGTTAYNGLYTITNPTATTIDIARSFVTDEGAVGSVESGWYKIGGATTLGSQSERIDMPANNRLRLLDDKQQPLFCTAVIGAQKAGAARLCEFAVFLDSQDGDGYKKQNGSFTRDITTRAGSLTARVFIDDPVGGEVEVYFRNLEGAGDSIQFNTLAVDLD